MKIFKNLLTALLLMCTAVATAHDFEVDGIYYNITDATNKTVRVTFRGNDSESYSNEYTGSVVIPESVIYDGSTYSVTSIGYSAFSECSGLTSVVIGNSVTSIGNCAFYGCSGLTSIEIPNSVTSIGEQAFYKCTGLTSVVIGKSVTSIGGDAFSYCSGLTSVEFNAENCTSMGSSSFPVFRCCEALFTITIGEKVKNIPGCAFYYCSRLKSIKIPNSVTSIGGYAFRYCSGLTSIEIPNSVTSIGGSAFNKCSGLTSVVIGNSVTSIGDGAFSECSGLTSVVIGNSVTSIGNLAFSDCTGLTSVVIPNSVTSIGGAAFKGCTGLTSIEIPSSVKSIGNTAFGSCENLKEVHINDIAAWCNISFGISAANPLSFAHSLYLNGELMKELVIPEGITSIGSYAFVQYTGLTSIEIPNSVTSIGSYAFYNCSGLTSVVIGDGVTSIGEAAFSYCSGLTSIEIPNSVTSIGKTAFYGCTGLTSIEIPNSVTSIGKTAFSDCSGLTSIEIPNSVTSIGERAFNGCYRLTSIEIPNSVTSIGDYAFYGCTKLKSVYNYSNLTFIKGSSSNGYIAYYANKVINAQNAVIDGDFIWCKLNGANTLACYIGEVAELTLPADYNGENYVIGNDAFNGCTRLTSITIPNSVTSIGDEAFYGCTALKTVINDSDLDIEKGLTSNGYVAYYADEVVANEFKFEFVDGVYTLVKYRGKGIKQEEMTTFDSWTSTNKGQSSSTSSYKYIFDATVGSKLSFDWSVSSEESYDELYVILDGTTVLTKSGVYSGNYEYTFTDAGSHTLEVEYTKDGSVDNNDDKAEIHNVKLTKTFYQPADVVLPDNYEGESYVIGESAFENNELVTSVTIPEGVEMICDKAFSGCINLENIVIPNSVSTIGSDAFAGTKWYDNEEDGMVYAGNVLYKYKGSMPENTAITINDGTLGIAGLAFAKCTGLTSIEIPTSVTNIGNYAFDGCTGLTSITSLIPADNLFVPGSDAFVGVDKTNCTLYVPYGAKETYASTEGWEYFENIVEIILAEITITINQYGCATYCSEYALDFTQVEGLKAYAATGYKSNSQVVTLTRVQTSEAGIGLFLKGEPGEYVVPVIESTDEHSLNMLVGTLEPTIVNSTAGAMSNYKFTIAEGDEAPMFYPFEDNTTFSAGKAYLQIPTAWLPATAQKSLSVRFDDGETTDIDELKGESGEVKTIYDLQGRVVENPTSGIYIIDGKKVIIK